MEKKSPRNIFWAFNPAVLADGRMPSQLVPRQNFHVPTIEIKTRSCVTRSQPSAALGPHDGKPVFSSSRHGSQQMEGGWKANTGVISVTGISDQGEDLPSSSRGQSFMRPHWK
ncbi:uncharacterized protein RHO17_014550 [Thomomys bottae]